MNLRGLRILVTGATSGIGLELARRLGALGAVVLVHGRSAERVAEVASSIPGAESFVADLASLHDVVKLAREVASRGSLDVVIANAGVGFGVPENATGGVAEFRSDRYKMREESRDGIELRFAVNYLAPFLLEEELRARGLPTTAIVNVASVGQAPVDFEDLESNRNYDGVLAYRRSKLALIMATFDAAASSPNVHAHALHPGTLLDTGMVKKSGIIPRGSASDGAAATLHVLRIALEDPRTGLYFDVEREARADAQAYDPAARRRLREAALKIVAPFRS